VLHSPILEMSCSQYAHIFCNTHHSQVVPRPCIHALVVSRQKRLENALLATEFLIAGMILSSDYWSSFMGALLEVAGARRMIGRVTKECACWPR
jgi:hypothetical protein